MSRKYSGLFVVVEGIDGTGKSTLVSNIYRALRKKGIDTMLTFEPTHGEWGMKLRRSFMDSKRAEAEEELSMFMKDRKEHLRDVIIPALQNGRVVLCDRYYFSTIAYQGARGLDPEKIQEENEEFALRPDICFILELDPEKAVRRITEGRMARTNNFEQTDYLKRVAEIFSSLKDECIIRLDAELSPDKLAEKAVEIILDRL